MPCHLTMWFPTGKKRDIFWLIGNARARWCSSRPTAHKNCNSQSRCLERIELVCPSESTSPINAQPPPLSFSPREVRRYSKPRPPPLLPSRRLNQRSDKTKRVLAILHAGQEDRRGGVRGGFRSEAEGRPAGVAAVRGEADDKTGPGKGGREGTLRGGKRCAGRVVRGGLFLTFFVSLPLQSCVFLQGFWRPRLLVSAVESLFCVHCRLVRLW